MGKNTFYFTKKAPLILEAFCNSLFPSSPPPFLNQCWFYRRSWLMINSKVYGISMSLKCILKGTRFPIYGSQVQNHWVAPRLIQPFVLLRLMKCVWRTSGDLVVESKLPPSGDSADLRQLNPIHKKVFTKALIYCAYSDFGI